MKIASHLQVLSFNTNDKKKMRPNDQRLKDIIRDEVIGVIWKDFKIIIHIFKNSCNETEKNVLMEIFIKLEESIK